MHLAQDAATVGNISRMPAMEELSVSSPHFLDVNIQNLHPFEADYLETTRSHLEPNQGNREGVPFQ
jgi:hypothetical protein